MAPSLPLFHMSSRRRATRLRTPIKTSVLTPRSWASSMTTTLYLLRRKSLASSRRRTPSVMKTSFVSGAVVDEYRMRWATMVDFAGRQSSARTRTEVERAATRRG